MSDSIPPAVTEDNVDPASEENVENSPDFLKKLEEAKTQFALDIENASDGKALIEAAKVIGVADKKLCALALNRGKKILLSHHILDDSFSKGGYGGMLQKEKIKFIDVFSAIREPSLIHELKVAMLSASGRGRPDFVLESNSHILAAASTTTQSAPTKIVEAAVPEAVVPPSEILAPASKSRKRALPQPFVSASSTSITSTTATSAPTSSGLVDESAMDIVMGVQSESVNTANVELLRQKALSVKAQRLSEALKDTTYSTLDAEAQAKIRNAYVNAVLGNESKDSKDV